jgi:hypothetical protein
MYRVVPAYRATDEDPMQHLRGEPVQVVEHAEYVADDLHHLVHR